MTSKGDRAGVGDGFSTAQERFANWRRERRRGERIPEELWELAVELGREHGVSRASRRLGVDYNRLKDRVEAGSSGATVGEARFVELLQGPRILAPECLVEYEDGSGARLRIELRGGATAQLECLARALRGATA